MRDDEVKKRFELIEERLSALEGHPVEKKKPVKNKNIVHQLDAQPQIGTTTDPFAQAGAIKMPIITPSVKMNEAPSAAIEDAPEETDLIVGEEAVLKEKESTEPNRANELEEMEVPDEDFKDTIQYYV